jgi:hypothetical protein
MLAEANDARSLRTLYDQLDDASLRERVIRVMAEIGDNESRRWLREIVERTSEPTSVRERAIPVTRGDGRRRVPADGVSLPWMTRGCASASFARSRESGWQRRP